MNNKSFNYKNEFLYILAFFKNNFFNHKFLFNLNLKKSSSFNFSTFFKSLFNIFSEQKFEFYILLIIEFILRIINELPLIIFDL